MGAQVQNAVIALVPRYFEAEITRQMEAMRRRVREGVERGRSITDFSLWSFTVDIRLHMRLVLWVM